MSWGWVALAPVVALIAGAPAHAASVDTRIGTAEGAADFGTGGGAGATYPGAVAPFGMVQLSPDTFPSTRTRRAATPTATTRSRGSA